MWFVYLLQCEDGSIYTGATNDIKKRFDAHKNGRGGRYTRLHKPIRILYSERFRTKGKSLSREAEIKSWPREKKLKLIKLGTK